MTYVSDTTMFKLLFLVSWTLFLVSWTLWMFTFVPPSQLQSTQRATRADPELTAKIDRVLENQDKMDRLLENEDKMDRLLENEDKMVENQDKMVENQDKMVESQDKMDRLLENQDKMAADFKSYDGGIERSNDDSSCLTQPNTNLKEFRCDSETDSSTEGGISTVAINGKCIQFRCERDAEFYPLSDWIVFLRRVDGHVIFHNRTWNETKHGFGDVEGSYWLGLDNINSLTQNARMMLKIDLEDFEGNKRYAEYEDFAVREEWYKYRLDIGEYSGNAGDSLIRHNGQAFSTWDQDNDDDSARHCATRYPGAWWYNDCVDSNLMGEYLNGTHAKGSQGIFWRHWRGSGYSYKTATMKMRPYYK